MTGPADERFNGLDPALVAQLAGDFAARKVHSSPANVTGSATTWHCPERPRRLVASTVTSARS